MSSVASRSSRPAVPAEWNQLELGVRRLLDDYVVWQRRAEAAERRVGELEQMLQAVSTGALDPQSLNVAVSALERENQDLRARLQQARERVLMLLSRVDFLAEDT